MSERTEQLELVRRARAAGWRVWHTPPKGEGEQPEAGEPDLRFLWRCDHGACPGPSRFLVAELKVRGGNHRTPAQRQAANDFAAAGVPCFEWRLPDDLPLAEAILGLEPTEAVEADAEPAKRRAIDPETRAAARAMGPRAEKALEEQWNG